MGLGSAVPRLDEGSGAPIHSDATRISRYDALNEYIQPVGSGIFAVLAGVLPAASIGDGLFPPPSLTERIENLQPKSEDFTLTWPPRLGAVGRGRRLGTRIGELERNAAGAQAAAIASARDAWVASVAGGTSRRRSSEKDPG